MAKNVFILGLTEFQWGELETLAGAGQWRFHSLLDDDRLVAQEDFDFGKLLESARAELADFSGSVDGIINHWDPVECPGADTRPGARHPLALARERHKV